MRQSSNFLNYSYMQNPRDRLNLQSTQRFNDSHHKPQKDHVFESMPVIAEIPGNTQRPNRPNPMNSSIHQLALHAQCLSREKVPETFFHNSLLKNESRPSLTGKRDSFNENSLFLNSGVYDKEGMSLSRQEQNSLLYSQKINFDILNPSVSGKASQTHYVNGKNQAISVSQSHTHNASQRHQSLNHHRSNNQSLTPAYSIGQKSVVNNHSLGQTLPSQAQCNPNPVKLNPKPILPNQLANTPLYQNPNMHAFVPSDLSHSEFKEVPEDAKSEQSGQNFAGHADIHKINLGTSHVFGLDQSQMSKLNWGQFNLEVNTGGAHAPKGQTINFNIFNTQGKQ